MTKKTIIRTKDNFYPNCTDIKGDPFLDEAVSFTSTSKAGNVRHIKLTAGQIVSTEESEESDE